MGFSSSFQDRWREGGLEGDDDEEDRYVGMPMPLARTIAQRTSSTTVTAQQPLNNRWVATSVSELPCFSVPTIPTPSMPRTMSTASSSSSSSSSSPISSSTNIFRHNISLGHAIVCAKSKKRYTITSVAENPTIHSTHTPIETLWTHFTYKDYFQCIEDGQIGDDLYIFQMIPTTGEIVVHSINEKNGKLIEKKSDKQTQQQRYQMALREKNINPTEFMKMIYPTAVYRDISEAIQRGCKESQNGITLCARGDSVRDVYTEINAPV